MMSRLKNPSPPPSRPTHATRVGAGILLLAGTLVAATPARAEVRLFILAGQSNMVGLNPAVSFTPTIKAAYPDDQVIVVKNAASGRLIRLWYKDWQPPTGGTSPQKGTNGSLYDRLMTAVNTALKDQPKPDHVTFVWMQGEADANHPGFGDRYRGALEGLLAQLRKDLGREDIDFVVGRISDFGNNMPDKRPSWNAVRAAQVAFAEADPQHRAWVDTDDLNGPKDALHYTREGYATLGKRFAEKAIALAKPKTP